MSAVVFSVAGPLHAEGGAFPGDESQWWSSPLLTSPRLPREMGPCPERDLALQLPLLPRLEQQGVLCPQASQVARSYSALTPASPRSAWAIRGRPWAIRAPGKDRMGDSLRAFSPFLSP